MNRMALCAAGCGRPGAIGPSLPGFKREHGFPLPGFPTPAWNLPAAAGRSARGTGLRRVAPEGPATAVSPVEKHAEDAEQTPAGVAPFQTGVATPGKRPPHHPRTPEG